MIIITRHDVTDEELDHIRERVEAFGLQTHLSRESTVRWSDVSETRNFWRVSHSCRSRALRPFTPS